MTPTIFAAILLAALLHALWNALAKRQAEGRVSVLLVSLCSGLFAAPFLPLVGWPVAAEYPWLALSILLHCGYCLFLGRAYRLGEFGQIYPLARGSAPLVTLLFGALLLGEVPGMVAVTGAVVLVSGVLLMAWRGGLRLAPAALQAVLVTALFTASYTLSDGAGGSLGRRAGALHPLAVHPHRADDAAADALAEPHRLARAGACGVAQRRHRWRPVAVGLRYRHRGP